MNINTPQNTNYNLGPELPINRMLFQFFQESLGSSLELQRGQGKQIQKKSKLFNYQSIFSMYLSW